MNTYLATKVSNSPHKYRTRGAVKAVSCSLINLKPPETFARPYLSNKIAKTDSESDWQEVNYKKKSVKSATKVSKPSTTPVNQQSIVNTSITSPRIDAGPCSSAPIHWFSRYRSIAVLLDPKAAGPMLWDIVDRAKQAVNPLTHLIQALRHLDQPIFGFAKTSDSGHYKQTDPYGFSGYLALSYQESQKQSIIQPALI